MENNKILNLSFLDLLFRGRNKDYGAYQLRKFYSRRLRLSLLISATVPVFGILFFLFSSNKKEVYKKTPIHIREVKLEDIKIEEPKLPPPPPPPAAKELTKQAVEKFTPPKIVPDSQVKPQEIPPKQEDLKDQAIGTKKVEGIKGAHLPSPPAPNAGEGQASKGEEGPLSKVEIEARYPGDWRGFLRNTLEYPEEAQDEGIQGSVILRFVVDIDGTVSNVAVISGPKELRKEAERAIKKSGKWIPAEQSGKKVKSYRTQVITFRLEE